VPPRELERRGVRSRRPVSPHHGEVVGAFVMGRPLTAPAGPRGAGGTGAPDPRRIEMRSTVGSAWVLLGAPFTSLGLRRGRFQRRLRHTGHPLRRVSPAASSPSSVTPPGWWRLPSPPGQEGTVLRHGDCGRGVLVAAVLLVSVVGTPLPTGISVVAALAFLAVVAWPFTRRRADLPGEIQGGQCQASRRCSWSELRSSLPSSYETVPATIHPGRRPWAVRHLASAAM
jgi:hypothetical protein